MSTIRVFNRAVNNTNHLVQMTLEINGKWFAFNHYMTQSEMIHVAQIFRELKIQYNYKQMESSMIGVERHKYNVYCFEHKVHVYMDINVMLTFIKLHMTLPYEKPVVEPIVETVISEEVTQHTVEKPKRKYNRKKKEVNNESTKTQA